MIARYEFEDVSSPAVDSSGNGFNATATGCTFGVAGVASNAIRLNGTTDKLTVAHNTALNLTGQIEITAVLKRSTTGRMRIVSKVSGGGSTNNPFDFGIGTDNKLYLVRADGSSFAIRADRRTVASGSWTTCSVHVGRTAFTDISTLVTMPVANAAWQGVASDSTYLYVLSDRDSSFTLSNTITKINKSTGSTVTTQTAAYDPFPSGDFYSFGSGNIIDGNLYVAAYNYNDGGSPLKSRIAIFDPSDLSFIEDFDLGTTVQIAEGVSKAHGYFWVIDGGVDRYYVYRYNSDFSSYTEFALPVVGGFYYADDSLGLTYQTCSWDAAEENLYVNFHGANAGGGNYAYGIDKYHWTGSAFTFVERIRAPSYGAGQGFTIDGSTWYFADRVANSILKTTFAGTGNGDVDLSSVVFAIDGIRLAVPSNTALPSTGNTSAMLIGARDDGLSPFNGDIDRLTITDAAFGFQAAWARHSNVLIGF